ncbi:MAG: hypothetical protein RIC16_07595 [Rhodospirillales bacterium]
MNLLAIPIRMALRYGRWMARGAGLTVAALMFAAIDRRDELNVPGMDQPYEVGVTDPYIAAVVVYVVTVKVLIGVMMRFHGAAQDHLARLRRH